MNRQPSKTNISGSDLKSGDSCKRKSREPVLVDQSIPYEKLLMIWPKEAALPAADQIPYVFVRPEEISELKKPWGALLCKLNFVSSEAKGEEIFASMRQKDPDYFDHHLYALRNAAGQLIFSAGIWYGDDLGDAKRIHWVMTDPDYQGQGLAYRVLSRMICDYTQKQTGESLYVSTQSQSWPAVLLYLKLGFVPLLSQPGQPEAWNRLYSLLLSKGIVAEGFKDSAKS